eukprot:3537122-Pleurochrysis_carterae.AAC.1
MRARVDGRVCVRVPEQLVRRELRVPADNGRHLRSGTAAATVHKGRAAKTTMSGFWALIQPLPNTISDLCACRLMRVGELPRARDHACDLLRPRPRV